MWEVMTLPERIRHGYERCASRGRPTGLAGYQRDLLGLDLRLLPRVIHEQPGPHERGDSVKQMCHHVSVNDPAEVYASIFEAMIRDMRDRCSGHDR